VINTSLMHTFAWWPTILAVIIASITDLRSRRIPNWLVFPFLVSGFLTSIYTRGWNGVWNGLSGFAVGALVCGLLAFLGGMGMGDVKLCAAIGMWVGPGQLISALVLTGIAGGAMALGWAVLGGFLTSALDNLLDLIRHMGKRGLRPHPELTIHNKSARSMPYAPAIAIGTLLSFLAR